MRMVIRPCVRADRVTLPRSAVPSRAPAPAPAGGMTEIMLMDSKPSAVAPPPGVSGRGNSQPAPLHPALASSSTAAAPAPASE